jgi:hypothetical protein
MKIVEFERSAEILKGNVEIVCEVRSSLQSAAPAPPA